MLKTLLFTSFALCLLSSCFSPLDISFTELNKREIVEKIRHRVGRVLKSPPFDFTPLLWFLLSQAIARIQNLRSDLFSKGWW